MELRVTDIHYLQWYFVRPALMAALKNTLYAPHADRASAAGIQTPMTRCFKHIHSGRRRAVHQRTFIL